MEAIQQTVPPAPQTAQDWKGGQQVKTGEVFQTRKLNTPLDKITRNSAGKRSITRTRRKRGRYIKAVPLKGRVEDLAFDATLRAAAVHQLARRQLPLSNGHAPLAFYVRRSDYHRKVRVRRAANCILFVVDASWSMAAAERMIATKGAIMSLLVDAYQKRDRVGLVVFQKEEARTVLPPTSSVDLAQKALKDVPVGGKTPLSAGLLLAHQILVREKIRDPEIMPLMICVTDGAGNVSMTDLPPQEEAHRIAGMFKKNDIRTVVINTEHEAFDRGLAATLAEKLGGNVYTLKQLRAEELYARVRENMK